MKCNVSSFFGIIQTAYKISLKPASAKYSASLIVDTVIGPVSFPRAILATSILLGVFTCGLNVVFNSRHFCLALLQFFSSFFLSKIRQGVLSCSRFFIFIFKNHIEKKLLKTINHLIY